MPWRDLLSPAHGAVAEAYLAGEVVGGRRPGAVSEKLNHRQSSISGARPALARLIREGYAHAYRLFPVLI